MQPMIEKRFCDYAGKVPMTDTMLFWQVGRIRQRRNKNWPGDTWM